MELGFAAPASLAPATLPDSLVLAALAARPVRLRGGQPRAAILLLELEVKGTG